MQAAASSLAVGRYEKMQQEDVPLYPNIYPPHKILPRVEGMDAAAMQPGPLPQVKPLLGPSNTVTTCQFCKAAIKTSIKHTSTSRTHLVAALWCIICCLCCVGYCSNSAKNSDHYCPNCERYLGTYEK